jgi:hypothetical protein
MTLSQRFQRLPLPVQDRALALVLLVVTFGLHLLSPITQSFDSRWVVHTSLSLLYRQDADLNEYIPQLASDNFYHVECIFPDGSKILYIKDDSQCPGGGIYHYYPLGVPVIVAPAMGLMDVTLRAAQPWLGPWAERWVRYHFKPLLVTGDVIAQHRFAELFLACLLIAVTTVVVYALARVQVAPLPAFGLALVFAFATPAWSTGSRALWQHGFSMFFLALVFLLMHWGKRWCWPLCGFLLALGFFVRPTNIVPLAVVGLWILLRHRRQIFSFVAGMVPVLVLFGAIHISIWGAPIPSYSQVSRKPEGSLSLGPHFPEALAGNLISPSRGLFLYVPIVFFAFAGMALWWTGKNPELRDWAWMFALIFLGHYVLVSLYEYWFGGHSYGPRYFSDITPLFVLPIAGLLARGWRWKWGAPYLATVAFCLFVHSQGAWCAPCIDWSVKPVELHDSQWRLWQWDDPMFLRGVREWMGKKH